LTYSILLHSADQKQKPSIIEGRELQGANKLDQHGRVSGRCQLYQSNNYILSSEGFWVPIFLVFGYSAHRTATARKTSHDPSQEKGTMELARDWQPAQKDDANSTQTEPKPP